MVTIDIFFFFSSSLIGFLYHLFLFSAPKQISVLSNLLLLFSLIAVIALGIASLDAAPSDHLYTFKRILFGYFGVQFLVGFPFGFLFRVWLTRALHILPISRAFQLHIQYIVMLTALLLTGLFIEPLTSMFSRLTGIDTAVVSLEFSSPFEHERVENLTIHGVPDAPAVYEAPSQILASMHHILARDEEYSRLLHGDPKEELTEFQKENSSTIEPLIKCFESLIEQNESKSSAGILRWLQLISKIYDLENIGSFENEFLTFLKFDCPIILEKDRSKLINLPYLSLMVAHLLQIDGHPQVGAKIIARWIDTHERKFVPNWYRSRAFVHLSLLISNYGDPQAAYNTAVKSVDILEDTMKGSRRKELRNWHTWKQRCTNGPPPKTSEEEEIERNIVHLYLTLISQSNILVRASMEIDRDGYELLKYAKRNASLPIRCYKNLLGSDAAKLHKAHYLATYGKLILSLADKKYFMNIKGKMDRKAYFDGRTHLLRALTVLQPLTVAEQAKIENSGKVEDALRPYHAREESAEIERELRRVERALNIR